MIRSIRKPFVAAALAFCTLFGVARPSFAALSDPPAGKWQFTLYKDQYCAGTTGSVSETGTNGSWAVSSLGSMNDQATAWSFCNGTGQRLKVTVYLFVDINLSGTLIVPATDAVVPDGTCLAGNHITPNDAVSSFEVIISLAN